MNKIQALLNPAAYPHPVTRIQVIETHISWVLLTGQYAYKIKKPVQFDFLDFSTLPKRQYYCQEELRFNRRFAPDLYLAVVPITGSEAHPQMNGQGMAIDYAVQMKQFDNSQLFSHIAERGELNASLIDLLADRIIEFHGHAARDNSDSHFGSAQEIHHWFQGNFTLIRQYIQDPDFLAQILQLEHWGEQTRTNQLKRFAQRKQQGFIRECHGDLHLGNITCIAGQVIPFDGIEFNPALHWIDVLSEIAFTVMDLQQRGLHELAYRLLNRYLTATGDYEGLALLPYYLVYRAMVRCKVAILGWQQHHNPQDLQEAQRYAALAAHYTTPAPARLFISHGYSGAGKSTYSAQIAEHLHIIHLRSDIERQRILSAGAAAQSALAANQAVNDQTGNQGTHRKINQEIDQEIRQEINQGRYTPHNVMVVYHRLLELASGLLEAGFSVLVDAAFLQSAQRDLFAALAREKNVDFMILDVVAPVEVLKQRIISRQQSGQDASEATLTVLEHQLTAAQPLSAAELENTIQIDTTAQNSLKTLLTHSRVGHPLKD